MDSEQSKSLGEIPRLQARQDARHRPVHPHTSIRSEGPKGQTDHHTRSRHPRRRRKRGRHGNQASSQEGSSTAQSSSVPQEGRRAETSSSARARGCCGCAASSPSSGVSGRHGSSSPPSAPSKAPSRPRAGVARSEEAPQQRREKGLGSAQAPVVPEAKASSA